MHSRPGCEDTQRPTQNSLRKMALGTESRRSSLRARAGPAWGRQPGPYLLCSLCGAPPTQSAQPRRARGHPAILQHLGPAPWALWEVEAPWCGSWGTHPRGEAGPGAPGHRSPSPASGAGGTGPVGCAAGSPGGLSAPPGAAGQWQCPPAVVGGGTVSLGSPRAVGWGGAGPAGEVPRVLGTGVTVPREKDDSW